MSLLIVSGESSHVLVDTAHFCGIFVEQHDRYIIPPLWKIKIGAKVNAPPVTT